MRIALAAILLMLGLTLGGCASFDSESSVSKVALKLQAGSDLNAGVTGQPLSLVTRIYKLKQTGAFNAAPYAAFLSPDAEKQALGADLIEVRELSLLPGQKYEVVEKVAPEANYLGIVTLFRTPAQQRWRAAFAVKAAERAGINIGLHACSLTVDKGTPAEQASTSGLADSPARCQPKN